MAKSLIIAATSLASASALVGPAAAAPRPSMPIVSGEPHLASSSSGASILALSSRRQFMASIVAGAATLTALPTPGHASYALYAASLDTINERKASGDWQKSIGSDTSALQEIQAGIAKKRPSYNQKAQKAPQYCAGQTAAVSPMMENRCQNIGVSKADQSNAMTDSCAFSRPAAMLHLISRLDQFRTPCQRPFGFAYRAELSHASCSGLSASLHRWQHECWLLHFTDRRGKGPRRAAPGADSRGGRQRAPAPAGQSPVIACS